MFYRRYCSTVGAATRRIGDRQGSQHTESSGDGSGIDWLEEGHSRQREVEDRAQRRYGLEIGAVDATTRITRMKPRAGLKKVYASLFMVPRQRRRRHHRQRPIRDLGAFEEKNVIS